MIYLRLILSEQQTNPSFLEYLQEGLADILQEVYRRRSKQERALLRQNLKELNLRYKTKISTPKQYIQAVLSSLSFTLLKTNVLIIQVSPKDRYYKLIKSIELGSYRIKTVPLLGKVLAVMPHLLEKLYTDYEMLTAKLDYYRTVDSVKYRLLTRYSLYKLSNRLQNKTKLF